jgi:hypothetical protein
MKKAVVFSALAAFLLSTTSACFGTFATTQKVWHWNARLDGNKFVRWGAFVGCDVIPVYASAVTFDLIFANSVEFWSGSNPIALAPIHGDADETAVLTPRADGAIDVSVTAPGRAERRFTLARDGDGVAFYDAEGTLVAHTD